jgi:rare lipoprotein A
MNCEAQWVLERDRFRARTRCVLLLVTCVAFLVLCLTNQGCQRKVPKDSKAETQADSAKEKLGASSPTHRSHAPVREVNASWYDVPLTSLAKRRAGLDELTAAHNRLPLGTRVRVTHLANGKSVVVRITDRGITSRKIKLDLCKEAASELGMISEGVARVRMEVLQEEPTPEPSTSPTVAAQL